MVGFKDVVLILSPIFVVVLLKGICVVVIYDRVVVRFTNWINVVVWERLSVVVCTIRVVVVGLSNQYGDVLGKTDVVDADKVVKRVRFRLVVVFVVVVGCSVCVDSVVVDTKVVLLVLFASGNSIFVPLVSSPCLFNRNGSLQIYND